MYRLHRCRAGLEISEPHLRLELNIQPRSHMCKYIGAHASHKAHDSQGHSLSHFYLCGTSLRILMLQKAGKAAEWMEPGGTERNY